MIVSLHLAPNAHMGHPQHPGDPGVEIYCRGSSTIGSINRAVRTGGGVAGSFEAIIEIRLGSEI